MKIITQEYKVLIDVLDNPRTHDMSDVLKDTLETGLLPEDGVALVSVEKAESK